MVWQDIAIAVIQTLLVVPLVPALFSPQKPTIFTSVGTGILLAALAGIFATLSLWYGAGATGIVSMLWLILGVQEYYKRLQDREHDHRKDKPIPNEERE